MKRIIIAVVSICMLASCSTREEIVYFEDIEKIEEFELRENFQPVIRVNDVLRITVSSMDEEVISPFQMSTGDQQSGGAQDLSLTGYLVDVEGDIHFPVLGEVHVAGKTRMEVQEMLQSRIRDYVTDAVVSVRLVNFQITVLGEVGSPGRIEVTDGRITIPQAIALAGDITYGGKRENILIIREIEGEMSYERVDITEANVFRNPYYFLRQNDIVYVEPTYRQVKSAGFITNYTGFFSLITSVVSLIFIFTR